MCDWYQRGCSIFSQSCRFLPVIQYNNKTWGAWWGQRHLPLLLSRDWRVWCWRHRYLYTKVGSYGWCQGPMVETPSLHPSLATWPWSSGTVFPEWCLAHCPFGLWPQLGGQHSANGDPSTSSGKLGGKMGLLHAGVHWVVQAKQAAGTHSENHSLSYELQWCQWCYGKLAQRGIDVMPTTLVGEFSWESSAGCKWVGQRVPADYLQTQLNVFAVVSCRGVPGSKRIGVCVSTRSCFFDMLRQNGRCDVQHWSTTSIPSIPETSPISSHSVGSEAVRWRTWTQRESHALWLSNGWRHGGTLLQVVPPCQHS